MFEKCSPREPQVLPEKSDDQLRVAGFHVGGEMGHRCDRFLNRRNLVTLMSDPGKRVTPAAVENARSVWVRFGVPREKNTVDTSFDYTYPSHILRISLVRILNHIISIHIPHPKDIQTSWGHHKQMAVSIFFFQVQASRCALPSLTCL